MCEVVVLLWELAKETKLTRGASTSISLCDLLGGKDCLCSQISGFCLTTEMLTVAKSANSNRGREAGQTGT